MFCNIGSRGSQNRKRSHQDFDQVRHTLSLFINTYVPIYLFIYLFITLSSLSYSFFLSLSSSLFISLTLSLTFFPYISFFLSLSLLKDTLEMREKRYKMHYVTTVHQIWRILPETAARH
jgi:hypothetical protein